MTLVPSKEVKMPPRTRTLAQNRALHIYATEVATELNNSGIGIDVFFKNVQADHTMESVKFLWQGFAMAKYGKKGTSQLTTSELNAVFEEVNRHIASFGLHIPFPSQENSPSYIESLDYNI